MQAETINIQEKFEKFKALWTPKIIGQMNEYHLKLARFKGDFTWHDHKDTDEVFLVIEGEMRIDFQDKFVVLREGELCIVPKGVLHKPFAEEECKVMLIEQAGTVNTGNAGGELTASNNDWI